MFIFIFVFIDNELTECQYILRGKLLRSIFGFLENNKETRKFIPDDMIYLCQSFADERQSLLGTKEHKFRLTTIYNQYTSASLFFCFLSPSIPNHLSLYPYVHHTAPHISHSKLIPIND